MDNDIYPTSQGILRCLQALAEEAACLGLAHTCVALREAIQACLDESGALLPATRSQHPAAAVH